MKLQRLGADISVVPMRDLETRERVAEACRRERRAAQKGMTKVVVWARSAAISFSWLLHHPATMIFIQRENGNNYLCGL